MLSRAATFIFVACLLAATFLMTGKVALAASEAEVTMDAKVGNDGKPLTTPVSWTITKLDKNGKPEKKPVVTEKAAVLKTKLKAGQYQVTVKDAKMAAKQTFTVGEAPVVRTIVLGNASVSIKMIMSKGRKPVKEPIEWKLLTYIKGQPGKGEEIDVVKAPTASFTVPAGGYVIRAIYNGVKADLVVPLSAGQSYDYTLNLYAGHAEGSAYAGKKKIAQDVSWQVVREKKNEKGEYELVTQQTGAAPKIMLREGKYVLIARYGNTWGSEKLSITAGEVSSVKINMKEDLSGYPAIAAE
jgi:hypothetical protein